MTFKTLFNYASTFNDVYIFTLKDYASVLFDAALNTNYFKQHSNIIQLAVQVTKKPNSRNKFLFVKFALDDEHVITLKEDNIDPNKSYRAVVLELIMIWLVQAANLRRTLTLEQVIIMLNNNNFATPQYFDMFAFRQLMTQEFADVNKFYVCSMHYLDTIVASYTVQDANAFRQAITDTFIRVHNGVKNNELSDEDIWQMFIAACNKWGIAPALRLSAQDKHVIISFLREKVQTFNADSVYMARTNLLSSALTNLQFKFWTDFTIVLARKIVYPRVKSYSLQC